MLIFGKLTMQLKLQSMAAQSSALIEVLDEVFAKPFKEPLIHQVITAYLAGGRSGTRAQKNRAQVSGGGIKPWRQKGTGRARAGSIRSPLWRGGGVIFPAQTADFSQKVNKKMYREALRSLLSELTRQERLVVVEDFVVTTPKTKDLLAQLQPFEAPSLLIVVETLSKELALSARNVYKVEVLEEKSLDPVSLVRFERVIITVAALRKLEERLA